MKAIETTGIFNEKGELLIDNPPNIKNKKVKLLFLFDEEIADDFYALSEQGLATAYSDNEPDYDVNMLKEPNPLYKK